MKTQGTGGINATCMNGSRGKCVGNKIKQVYTIENQQHSMPAFCESRLLDHILDMMSFVAFVCG